MPNRFALLQEVELPERQGSGGITLSRNSDRPDMSPANPGGGRNVDRRRGTPAGPPELRERDDQLAAPGRLLRQRQEPEQQKQLEIRKQPEQQRQPEQRKQPELRKTARAKAKVEAMKHKPQEPEREASKEPVTAGSSATAEENSWQDVDESAMNLGQRCVYRNRKRAMELYRRGCSPQEIFRLTGICVGATYKRRNKHFL